MLLRVCEEKRMKRSEVVQHIADTIKVLRQFTDIRSDKEVAEHVMRTIESSGMLPPFKNDKVDHTCQETEICLCNMVWEDDDSTK